MIALFSNTSEGTIDITIDFGAADPATGLTIDATRPSVLSFSGTGAVPGADGRFVASGLTLVWVGRGTNNNAFVQGQLFGNAGEGIAGFGRRATAWPTAMAVSSPAAKTML